jgi:hypothetical protein
MATISQEQTTHQRCSLWRHPFFNGLWTHLHSLQRHRLLQIRVRGFWLVEKPKDQRLGEG